MRPTTATGSIPSWVPPKGYGKFSMPLHADEVLVLSLGAEEATRQALAMLTVLIKSREAFNRVYEQAREPNRTGYLLVGRLVKEMLEALKGEYHPSRRRPMNVGEEAQAWFECLHLNLTLALENSSDKVYIDTYYLAATSQTTRSILLDLSQR
jgi:hypothetical protein